MNSEKILRAFRSLMVEKDIRALDLAKKLNVNRSTICRVIGRNANPTLNSLIKFSDAIDIPLCEIIIKAENLK